MTSRRDTIIGAVLATLVARDAAAEPLFTSPPHFVADRNRRRIVLFVNEPLSGALAARGPDGTFEIRVPGSTVAPAIQGRDFGTDGWGDSGEGVRHLVLATGAKGDTNIHLDPGVPVGGVDAHAEDDPPRLVLELLAVAPTRAPMPAPTRTPRRSGATAAAVAPSPVPKVMPTTVGRTAPTVTKKVEPVATAAPPPVVPRIPGSVAPLSLGCLWRRVAGVAFCAADPKAPAYVGDRTVTTMLGTLARGRVAEPEGKHAVDTPAQAFVAADRALVTQVLAGKPLPAVADYQHALRQHPEFPEAWRARLNIALLYRAMEFRAELRVTASEAVGDPTAGLVRGLAGDVAFVTGQLPMAANEYRMAAEAGGVGACLAARGRARLALAKRDGAVAASEVATLASLCPPELLTDPETVLVRAQLALANGDTTTARRLLGEIRDALGTQDQGAVIADLGAVEEAAGDVKAARASYERLLGGAYGARAARRATVRLAMLDGDGGDLTAGLKRLGRLTPEASDQARRVLVMEAVRRALARGQAGEAIAILHEARVDPGLLSLDEQLVVARAYRGVGLDSDAEGVLAAAQANAGASPPDALFAERAALALERRDGAQGLAIADEWIRTHGSKGDALGLRARAVALTGDGIGAHAAVAAAVREDPSLTRTLALEVAGALRDREPTVALVLAREALAPGPTPELPEARAAAGYALIGALAEAAGDDDTALAAFTTLRARYGQEAVAADAAYRAARVAARRAPGGGTAAYDEAARSKDALARRVAGAARDYEAIVRPLAGTPSGSKAQP